MENFIKKNLKIIIVSLIFLIFIIILFISNYYLNEFNKKENKKSSTIVKKEKSIKRKTEKEKNTKEEKTFYFVEIKGAVKNPGVYKVEKNLRVNDVINLSGGLLENSDTSILNLSKKIKDEMLIIVYTFEELQEYKNKLIEIEEINNEKQQEIICPDKSNDACITSSNENSKKETSSNEENKLISINTATKEELMSIKGIGESKADSIIKYREENGEFKKIEDIKNVSGIGDSVYEKIKDYISI